MNPTPLLDFAAKHELSLNAANHHFSGPPHVWQTPGHGSVSHLEGSFLTALARKLGGPVLEIGSDLGISTRYIHEGLEDGSCIYAVDVNHKWEDDDTWPMRRRVVASGADFEPPSKCSWAFIDGDHRYDGVCADIRQCLSLGIGRLVFHDTHPRFSAWTPTNTSDGSRAREAVIDLLYQCPTAWTCYDFHTESGLIFAHKTFLPFPIKHNG